MHHIYTWIGDAEPNGPTPIPMLPTTSSKLSVPTPPTRFHQERKKNKKTLLRMELIYRKTSNKKTITVNHSYFLSSFPLHSHSVRLARFVAYKNFLFFISIFFLFSECEAQERFHHLVFSALFSYSSFVCPMKTCIWTQHVCLPSILYHTHPVETCENIFHCHIIFIIHV